MKNSAANAWKTRITYARNILFVLSVITIFPAIASGITTYDPIVIEHEESGVASVNQPINRTSQIEAPEDSSVDMPNESIIMSPLDTHETDCQNSASSSLNDFDLRVADEAQADTPPSQPTISYATHISNLGWQAYTAMGEAAGTTGRSLSIEALKFEAAGMSTDDLLVCAHLANIGWKPIQSGSEIIGSIGQSRPIEAISIKLSDTLSASYDLYYQVHVSNIGWLDWASNGAKSGTTGYGYPIEAIRIQIQDKASPIPGPTDRPYIDRTQEPPTFRYSAHANGLGWMPEVVDGDQAGTTGQTLALNALHTDVSWYGHTGTIELRAHVQNIGWTDWNEQSCGTANSSNHLEAFQARLTGELAENYDLWYRSHSSQIGWMGWTSNGNPSGTSGKSLPVEAVQFLLVKKGGPAPGETANAWQGQPVSISGTISLLGGGNAVASGQHIIIGDPKSARLATNISLKLNNLVFDGSISYCGLHEFSLWDSAWSSNGKTLAFAEGQQLEALKIELAGSIATTKDLWYRTHGTISGWSGWAKNGEPAGTQGFGSGINALEIVLMDKNAEAPGSQYDAMKSYQGEPSLRTQGHSTDLGWNPSISGGTIGTTGKSLSLQALRVNIFGDPASSVQVEAHVAELGWQQAVSEGSLAGTVGKGLPLEAVKLRLTGPAAQTYELIYRAHVSDYGWLGWTKDGDAAGTVGLSKPIEALEIQLVPAGTQLPDNDAPSCLSLPTLNAECHVADIGWMPVVGNGEISGTIGQSRAIEAIKLNVSSSLNGSICYSAHVQDFGWMNTVSNGALAGSTGQGKQIEAVRISLTGDLSNYFDIWYRAHVENYGWLGWTKNGADAGTGSISLRLEALQIKITPKGESAPGSTERPYTDKPVRVPYALLGVPAILQMPELPTGCESVALTSALNLRGFNLPKTAMADSYIPRSNWDFVTSFWGDPHSTAGNCCSAPAITNAANTFLAQKGSSLRAYDISGISLEGMYDNIQKGNPVIVWSTMYQQPIGPAYAWQSYNNKQYFTVTNSHTVVLRGFDLNSGQVFISDPLSGYKAVNSAWFNQLYIQRGSQAVVIK